MRVLIDGRPVDPREASVSVFDVGLLRGDGCFEAVRSYRGRPFRLQSHLDRMERSAGLLGLDLPARHDLAAWVQRVASDGGDCVVRIIATRGSEDAQVPASGRLVVFWEPLPELPDALTVLPIPAPWHASGSPWELAGAKTLSYAPNMAARRHAQAAGFDDALLITRDGHVLEGPTFCFGWMAEGALETPSLDLGILASITRTVALEEARVLGVGVNEGRFLLDRLAEAEEVFALSTVKEVHPVARVGELLFEVGAFTRKLADAYAARVAAETL